MNERGTSEGVGGGSQNHGGGAASWRWAVLLIGVGFLLFSSEARGQSITWGTAQNMVDDNDIKNNGKYVDAASFYLGGTPVVNGVAFNPLAPAGTVVDPVYGFNDPVYSDGKISAITPNGGTTGNKIPSTLSTNYGNIVSVIGFGYFVDGVATLSDLTEGKTYQVQVISAYGYSSAATTTLTGTNSVTLNPEQTNVSSDPNDFTGQYAIGTFTATGPTETFTFNFNAAYGVIDAVSVRDITVEPEPSSLAVLLLSGVGLLGRRRRLPHTIAA